MKNALIIGTILGIAAATVAHNSKSQSTMKRLKRAALHKLEDTIM